MAIKVLFIIPYPVDEAPSQRFRFEQYIPFLGRQEIQYSLQGYLTKKNWRVFYGRSHPLLKVVALSSGFIKRIIALPAWLFYDFIFIHREIIPFGPPFFEFILAKVLRRKIIYDFDDAIWMTDKTHESWLEKKIRWRGKVATICRWSYKVSCGNEYLLTYAMQFNRNVVLNPTTIDTEQVHNKNLFSEILSNKKIKNEITIGWTGSHSTLKYLKIIEPTLQQIERKYPQVSFLVIANQEPDLQLKRMIFKPWSKENEIKDLLLVDIGIMPLPDDVWAKGKCGFKALQYMALEIPAIASPVGVNTRIIKDGENGFLCNQPEEWFECIEKLIINQNLRSDIGKAGRETVEKYYSVKSNTQTFLNLFN